MSWSNERAEEYFHSIRSLVVDRAVELRGELWDYGAKLRMQALWSGEQWEFAKDWSVDTAPPPADVAAAVINAIKARREEYLATLTDAERRAFEFGPWIRRVAETEYAGRLPDAIIHRCTWNRWDQHMADVSQIRLSYRRAYVDAIYAVGGSREDLLNIDWVQDDAIARDQ